MFKPFRKMSLNALVLCAAAWPSGVAAQTKLTNSERLVRIEPQRRSDAVMITKVTVGDTEVQCGLVVGPNKVQPVTPFQSGDDWLQHMAIYYFNRTDKTIIAADVMLGFPETAVDRSQPHLMFPIKLGRRPRSAAFIGSTGQPIPVDSNQAPIAIAPGKTLVIHVGDYADKINEQVAHTPPFTPLMTVREIFIYTGPFHFEDGMRWDIEGFSVPDPERPGKFKRMPDGYFPGQMYHNWPPGYRY